MRLEPQEARRLPLPAALVDLEGEVVAATPEWRGPAPGTVSYHAGYGHLLVSPDLPAPELDVLMGRLLEELAAVAAGGGEAGRRTEVVRAGLALVAGRPLRGRGTAETVAELARAAVRARTQGLELEVHTPLPAVAVPAPGAIALAVVQLAVNAWHHEGAPRVALRVDPAPTFWVEWPSTAAGPTAIRTHRHTARRRGWGWGYVQMVADALGAAALPPAPAGTGRRAAGLGLGSPCLTLPLACVRRGRVARSTPAWDEDPAVPPLGAPVAGLLEGLVADALAREGQVVYRDLYRARAAGDRIWAAQAPESGSNRARDLLRGLRHERALWDAPGPRSSRVAALATLLEVALGAPWPSVPPSVYAELLPAACHALGVPCPEPLEGPVLPEPRVVAYLLAELGGRLVQRGETLFVVPAPERVASPLLRALRTTPEGWIRVSMPAELG
ncbi:MAG TPA: hypothetical protein VFD01_07020 [Candidatus Dormibacteraeota bacterium]|nr:hypothetical protein [Candidatus Dormibacteraeota bacterium]